MFWPYWNSRRTENLILNLKTKKNLKQIIEMQNKKTGKLFNFFAFYAVGVLAKKDKKIKKTIK